MAHNPTFQHRHYSKLANLIANTKTRDELIAAMIATFRRDNPLFDTGRFLLAAKGNAKNWRDREEFVAPEFVDRMATASRE